MSKMNKRVSKKVVTVEDTTEKATDTVGKTTETVDENTEVVEPNEKVDKDTETISDIAQSVKHLKGKEKYKELWKLFREKRKIRKRKRNLKEKARYAKKRSKYLYYKIYNKRHEWHPLVYWPLQIITIPVEIVRKLFRFYSFILFSCITIGFCAGILFLKLVQPTYDTYSEFAHEAVDNSDYDTFRINESSIIYDNKGRVLANIHETADTEYLYYNDIPSYVIDAFIAIEDRTFWTNSGVDFKGLARVVYDAIRTDGGELHGASTITQQLARNIFLTHQVSLERKGKEMLIAMYLTEKYSKEDIMEFYCNDICFANGIYGIEGAAKAYFGRSVKYCSLKQIAYLCAIPNRPEYYDPYVNYRRALDRCNKILEDMYSCGYITEEELTVAKSQSIKINPQKFEFNDYQSSYAIDCAIRFLMQQDNFEFKYVFDDMDDYSNYRSAYNTEYEQMRHKLYIGGYKIYTSIDTSVYEQLQEVVDNTLAFDSGVDEETGIYKLQGAVTCIDNETGKVIAVVGGRTQEKEEQIYSLNRAYQSYRQPGSTIKPVIVYTPVLEKGYTADTLVQNISVTAAKEKDANVQALSGDIMTLRQGVEQSKNGVAWQVFDKLTPQIGLSYVNNMKFSRICPNDYFNASALGGFTYGVTTVEMAGAYCAIARHGIWIEPTCIRYIKTRSGETLTPDDTLTKIYKAKAADDMVDILRGVLTHGTAAKLSWGKKTKMDAFCKTGTTNKCKDGWLCGATPYYTISVWIGYDQPKELNNLYGATYPGQIWRDCMLKLIDGKDNLEFVRLETDESYHETVDIPKEMTGYYSYMPGRDDSEILSSNYTVANYREDRVIGESVYMVISNIENLSASTNDAMNKLDKLYSDGNFIISEIYSRKYTAEMQGKLDAVYNMKKAEIMGTPVPTQTPQVQN